MAQRDSVGCKTIAVLADFACMGALDMLDLEARAYGATAGRSWLEVMPRCGLRVAVGAEGEWLAHVGGRRAVMGHS